MKKAWALMMAAMIAFGYPAAIKAESIFSPWAQPYIERASALGMLDMGAEQDYTQPISRAQFCGLMVAVIEPFYGEIFTYTGFEDTESLAVKKLGGIELMAGASGKYFAPEAVMTREQIAVALYQALQQMGLPAAPLADSDESEPFADATAISPWATAAVNAVRQHGLMSGDQENRFRPEAAVTQEEAIVLLTNLYELLSRGAGV